MRTWLIIIRYCCGKQCELLLNWFLIKELHHRLNLLCHLPLSSIIDNKIQLPNSFSTLCRKTKFDPSTSSFNPHLQKISTPPPPFWQFDHCHTSNVSRFFGQWNIFLNTVIFEIFTNCIAVHYCIFRSSMTRKYFIWPKKGNTFIKFP